MRAATTIKNLSRESTKSPHQDFFEDLYESAFPAAARFVHSMGGTLADARDVFQDAVIILYEKLVSKQTEIGVSHQAYLLGITKHLWIKKFKENQGKISLSDWEQSIQIPDLHEPQPQVARLARLLETAGQKCLELLRSFYYDRLNLRQIADTFGFGSERSATVQKYKCLEKVRNEVKLKTLTYADFTD